MVQCYSEDMKTRKRELAKAGIFGSLENPVLVKESDLKEIVETFPDIKKAPIKLGNHWSDDKPRLGNVVAVEYDEKKKTLFGTIEEHDTLAEAVDQGFYPDVSIGAKARASDGKMYLHHLAYLGDEPPAIKDLVSGIAEDMQKAQDEPEGKLAASDSEGVIALPSVMARQLYLSDSPGNKEPEDQEKQNSPENQNTKKEVSLMTEEEIKEMQAENERLKKENEEKETLLSDSIAQVKAKAKEELKKAAEGKITQPQMEELLNLADTFQDGKTIELSDGVKKTPVEVLAGIFSSIKPRVEEGKLNLSDTEPATEVEMDLSRL